MAESAVGHQTVVHTLDKWRNYEGRQCFYGVDNFLGTEPQWDSVPLIFAQQHPNLKMVKNNLNEALQRVKDYKGRPGKIAGHLEQSRVMVAGQPRLETKTVFDDPEVQELYNQGKLSLSSGFVCNENGDGRLDGKVEPNHMLVFVQDRYNQGREPGAMFLNKEEGVGTEHSHIGKVISNTNKGLFKQALDSLMSLYQKMAPEEKSDKEEVDMDKEKEAELEKLKAEMVNKEKLIADQTKELADVKLAQEKLNKEVTDAREAQKKIADAKADQEWANLKKTYIPPGMVKDPNDEKSLRELAVSSPMEFHNKVAAVRIGQKKEAGGREFSNKGDEDAAEQAEMNRILGTMTKVPGTLH